MGGLVGMRHAINKRDRVYVLCVVFRTTVPRGTCFDISDRRSMSGDNPFLLP